MKYYESYEKIYSKGFLEIPGPNQSLLEFYSQEIKNRLPAHPLQILEVGCGASSLFQNIDGEFEVLGIDVSPSAIKIANENNNSKKIKFETLDVTSMNFENKFDLVFDSHCFHCLTNLEDRKKALSNIYKSLKKGGFFVLETMASHKNMSFENPYLYQENILFRLNTFAGFVDLKFFDGAPFLPVRRINHPMETEQEILSANFRIIFLYVFAHKKMIPDERRSNPLNSDPDSLQIIAQKI